MRDSDPLADSLNDRALAQMVASQTNKSVFDKAMHVPPRLSGNGLNTILKGDKLMKTLNT